ncbi:MAG: acyl carrier protein [Zunongwangia sp.]|jgi:acyl carrier protein|nr:acyl carrier protein [Zunongwangia sp.]MCC4229659.1 phosphopantetheine-binding protein [Zunongwangia profunda]UAB83493.1 acyl carrier protein [Zunongwangia sp. SCSIO 43204]SFC08391.1 acyl carrier protein [Zunongwangia mangrovi]MAS71912.1 acyl carrier protein [Zunongwangia sp.]
MPIMTDLHTELKASIIEQLNLEDMEVSDIENDEPLFGDGLGLDSIDALELIVLLEKDYGIKLTDPKKGREIFESINKMADFIEANRTK